MNSKIQNMLILLISILILSITPATAIQNQVVSDDWNSTWNKGVEELIKVIEGDDTKLTPEQSQYLETHEDQVQTKGETVLYNLQNYINYLIKEYNKYYPIEQQNNPVQRKLLETPSSESSDNSNDNTNNKYKKDAETVTKYLKSINTPTKTENLNYKQLSQEWNDSKWYGDRDGVIIQVADKEYVRYLQILNITGEGNSSEIRVRHDKKEFTMGCETFKNSYLPNEYFNIIIVPKNYDTPLTLHRIFTFKRDNLYADINWCNWGMGLCIPITVLGISGIVLNGVWKCCESCKSKTVNQIKKSKPKDVDESTPLVVRYDEERAEIQADSSCCKKPRTIIILGTLIALGALIGSIISVKVKNVYDADLKNLGEYVQL